MALKKRTRMACNGRKFWFMMEYWNNWMSLYILGVLVRMAGIQLK